MSAPSKRKYRQVIFYGPTGTTRALFGVGGDVSQAGMANRFFYLLNLLSANSRFIENLLNLIPANSSFSENLLNLLAANSSFGKPDIC